MADDITITAEERRAAWRAFFRKPLAWAGVIIFFIPAAYVVDIFIFSASWENWKSAYNEENFWADFALLMSGWVWFFYFVLTIITLEFGILHGITKNTFLVRMRHLFNPNKLLQHPLYPTKLRKAMRIGHIAFCLSLVYVVSFIIMRSS